LYWVATEMYRNPNEEKIQSNTLLLVLSSNRSTVTQMKKKYNQTHCYLRLISINHILWTFDAFEYRYYCSEALLFHAWNTVLQTLFSQENWKNQMQPPGGKLLDKYMYKHTLDKYMYKHTTISARRVKVRTFSFDSYSPITPSFTK